MKFKKPKMPKLRKPTFNDAKIIVASMLLFVATTLTILYLNAHDYIQAFFFMPLIPLFLDYIRIIWQGWSQEKTPWYVLDNVENLE